MAFIHLRLHTAYSLAEGAIKVKELPKICKQKGFEAVGITDTNNMFGALEIAMALANEGVQPIVGVQALICVDEHTAPMVLLAQNEEGYHNLLKLMGIMYGDGRCKLALEIDELGKFAEGIIALSGGDIGVLGKLLLAKDTEKAEIVLQKLHDIYQDKFYMEIMRHGTEKQLKTEQQFIDWGFRYKIPFVATNNVQFSEKKMYEAHDALLCIAEGAYVSQSDRRKVTDHHYFKTSEEMNALFSDLPEAVLNTEVIAKRCYFMPTPRKPILPPFESPSGLPEVKELDKQAREGLEKRLIEEVFPLHPKEQHKPLRDTYVKRLEYELGIVEKMGFPGYFLIVADFIKFAKSKGIPVGPGRGSGAGSLVAWSITITDIDPIRFSLIFERFLNPERVSMPDFDVDFCQDRRDEVIDYVCQKYGKDKVASIITFGKLQAKAVIRDVGRVLQMPYGQVDRISKLVPNNPANPVTISEALEIEPLLQEAKSEDSTVDNLLETGMQLEGLYRHASTHAAGIVIGDRPLDDLIPIYRDDRSELTVTQFNMKYVEQAGLVKFDFLGLKTLTVIETAARMIRESVPDFEIRNVPLDDPKTFELLTRMDTVGVFQVESAGMKDILKKLKPDRFEDLIALVALYRPGPMDDIPRYLRCKHGEEPVRYLHPSLEPILETTYGVMVYQEQVMQIAQVLGGYTLGAADLLRRAMGKKIKEEMDKQREIFTKGAIDFGVKEDIAHKIFDQMAKFAGYGFNKSHSAPYALLTYQTAYIKANYPLAFYAASMTLDVSNTDKLNIFRQDIENAKVQLLPPDINESMTTFDIQGEGVRYGLAAIKNVGANAVDLIVAEREKGGNFKDLADFSKRVDPKSINKRLLEQLIAAGAFDCLHENRNQMLGAIDMIVSQAQISHKDKTSRQKSLFGGEVTVSTGFKLPNLPDLTGLDKLQKEFEALGFYLSAHPISIYNKLIRDLNVTKVSSIEKLVEEEANNQALTFAGVLIAKQERTAKSGNKFAFAQFSDETGVFETGVFGETFQRIRENLTVGDAFYISATLRVEEDEHRLIANDITPLTEKAAHGDFVFEINDEVDLDLLIQSVSKLEAGPNRLFCVAEFDGLPRVMLEFSQKMKLDSNIKGRLLGLRPVKKDKAS